MMMYRKKALLTLMALVWMPVLVGAASSSSNSESNQHLEQFLELPYGPQTHIGKYLLGGEIKQNLFDRPVVKHILRGHECWVRSATFNEEGTRVVSAGTDGTVRIWDAQIGQPLRILEGHIGWVGHAVFNKAGTQIASISLAGIVRIWDVQTGQLLRELRDLEGRIRQGSVAFNKEETHIIAVYGDGTESIWDVQTGDQLLRRSDRLGAIRSGVFDQKGTRAASGISDGNRRNLVRIWDTQTGRLLHTLHSHEGWIYSVALNEEGTLLASAGDDRMIRIWDVETGQLLHVVHGHEDKVWSVAFNKQGTQIVSASFDDTVRIWDLKLPYDRYHFTLEQALWIYNRYHEIMAGDKDEKGKEEDTVEEHGLFASMNKRLKGISVGLACLMHGTGSHAESSQDKGKEEQPELSREKKDQIMRHLSIEQSIRERYPEILDQLQALRMQMQQTQQIPSQQIKEESPEITYPWI